ncbi:MAG: hypothetical protein JKX94_03225 [Sneathiella sp.]|nr:hypothetical protein [Sneathiella sp.]
MGHLREAVSSLVLLLAFSAFSFAEEKLQGEQSISNSHISSPVLSFAQFDNLQDQKHVVTYLRQPYRRDLPQILHTMSLDIVRRQTSDQNLIYVIDTSNNYEKISRNLQRRLGNMLEHSSLIHQHSVEKLVALLKNTGGWPLASYYRLTDDRFRSVCIISPLSQKKSGMEFAAKMMGNQNLPVVHEINEFVIHFLSMAHESYHCLSSNRSGQERWSKTSFETIADVGAVNEALKLGVDVRHLIALSDWRALRFASAIANVVSGRDPGKAIYYKASPSHMSAVAIERLLYRGGVNTYDEIKKLALSATAEGLYGQKKKAQKFLTRIFLLYKNTVLKKRFQHASIQDVDEILTAIDAPKQMVNAVKNAVARYLAKLQCRNVSSMLNGERETKLVCLQSDGSYIFADRQLLGIPVENRANLMRTIKITVQRDAFSGAEHAYLYGQKVTFLTHQQYHRIR